MSIKQRLAALLRWSQTTEEEKAAIAAKQSEGLKEAWKKKPPALRREITSKRLKTLRENRKKRNGDL